MEPDRSNDCRDVAAWEGSAASSAAGPSNAYSVRKAIRFQVKATRRWSLCSVLCVSNFKAIRRLGLRTAAMLISPWIPKGSVFQEPKGPYNTSQFELSSICSTAKTLFGAHAPRHHTIVSLDIFI